MAWIEVKDFTYTYPGGDQPALHQVNLSLERGNFVLLTGKSGSGKSTLGKALAGFLFVEDSPQFTGEIIINQTDMTQVPLYEASKRVAYVQQNPEDQFCTLKVADEIAFGLENKCHDPEEIEERIDWALTIVEGLSLKNRELHSLSGGEKQKIVIASMLALKPDVLILDEPTSNLDPDATLSIFNTLNSIRHIENMTVIIIEHKLSQLIGFEPQIFSLHEGRLNPGLQLPERQDQKPQPIKFVISHKKGSQTESIIDVKGLTVKRAERIILKDINLSLAPGQLIALMGPNGSGKSTLLETLMGFHPIQSGKGWVLGHEISQVKVSELVQEVGFIFQNPDHQLFTQSVWDEAVLTSRSLGTLNKDIEKKASDWLIHIGLEFRQNDHPQKLSYGEKRRLNVVAALLHRPKLLLIDEFLIGQDMDNSHRWMRFFRKLTADGRTLLLAIHHPELTRQYCDRVIFLEDGKIQMDKETKKAFEFLAQRGRTAFLPVEISRGA